MPEPLVLQPQFRPDRVETPSEAHTATLEEAARQPGYSPPQTYELPRGTRGVRLRLTAVQVMGGVAGFLRPEGGVYVVTSVVDGLGEQPITFSGKVYQGIREGQMLPLGREGDPQAVFNVYLREGQMPRLLSFSLLVVRSNEGLREMGRVITRTVQDERYKQLSEIVGTASSAASPAYGIVWQAADEAISLLGGFLAAKPDDQLCYYQANYPNLFDDLGRGKHPPDAPTMEVDKVRFAYEINAV